MSRFKLTKLCIIEDDNRNRKSVSEAGKTYKFFKDDADKKPITITAMDDNDADEKIKKITGKDPGKVTKWSEEANEAIDYDDADMTEETTTSDMDGGAGQPMVPHAFSKKVRKPHDIIYTNELTVPKTDVVIKTSKSDIANVEFRSERGKGIAYANFYSKYPSVKKVGGPQYYTLTMEALDKFLRFLDRNGLKYEVYTPSKIYGNEYKYKNNIG